MKTYFCCDVVKTEITVNIRKWLCLFFMSETKPELVLSAAGSLIPELIFY